MHPLRLLVVAPTLTALISCGGGAGEKLRPKDYTGTEALAGVAPVCAGAPRLARPLTVDLDADVRGDLEASMKKGVVVVAYDCATLRVLSNCRLADGDYEYAGVSRKEEVVQMKGMDELRVNLPVGSAKLGGEVQAGRSVDLALVSVGRRSTTLGKVEHAQLTGTCDGATHFVQKAFLGAFSIATGSVGKAAVVADLFQVGASGKSESERKASSSDGSLEACRKSDPDSEAPPAECRAPLRVELVPIVGEAPPASTTGAAGKAEKREIEPEVNPCPSGYNFVSGLCSKSADAARLCDVKDAADCKAQCDKGSAASCLNYGTILLGSKKSGEAKSPFKKACDAGDVEGCAGYANLSYPGELTTATLGQAKEALEMSRKACTAGSMVGCGDVSSWLRGLDGSEDKRLVDMMGGLRASERGCALGDATACQVAGSDYLGNSFGVPKNSEKAIALLGRGCDGGGDASQCQFLAKKLLVGGAVIPKDPERGVRFARRACSLDADTCAELVKPLIEAGKVADAFTQAKRGCEVKQGRGGTYVDTTDTACGLLGDLYAAGTGTPKDAAKASEAWVAACKDGKGSKSACSKAKK